MRIVSGKYRSRIIKCQEGKTTRPTSDRVREAIFSIISPYITGAKVLDLFAGTGALAIESLSRGAESAISIENSKEAWDILNCNKTSIDPTMNLEIRLTDAFNFLVTCNTSFDLVFLDPPYRSGFYDKVLQIIAEKDILKSGKLIVIEHDKEWTFNDRITEGFTSWKEKKYGKTYVTILMRQ